uniref:MHC class I-like antigen recognition-like domain-containing protein n=1 Tax=Seriola lalandi dorsalis TaxID=1841481 RepID=A0A3B4XEU0_SERLL
IFRLLFVFIQTRWKMKHSLKYVLTVSSGVTNLPLFVTVALIDDIQAGYCDSDKESLQLRDWVKNYLDTDPQHLAYYKTDCYEILQDVYKARMSNMMQRLNHSDGVHILQRISEDFISLDLNTLTWIALNPLAVVTKLTWDADKARIKRDQNFLTQICPEWLKKYLDYGRSSLQRTGRIT